MSCGNDLACADCSVRPYAANHAEKDNDHGVVKNVQVFEYRHGLFQSNKLNGIRQNTVLLGEKKFPAEV